MREFVRENVEMPRISLGKMWTYRTNDEYYQVRIKKFLGRRDSSKSK